MMELDRQACTTRRYALFVNPINSVLLIDKTGSKPHPPLQQSCFFPFLVFFFRFGGFIPERLFILMMITMRFDDTPHIHVGMNGRLSADRAASPPLSPNQLTGIFLPALLPRHVHGFPTMLVHFAAYAASSIVRCCGGIKCK